MEALYYNFFVPEGERHASAIKRNQDALTVELKLWDGYMKKVTPVKFQISLESFTASSTGTSSVWVAFSWKWSLAPKSLSGCTRCQLLSGCAAHLALLRSTGG